MGGHLGSERGRYPPQKGELRTLENHDEIRDVEEVITVDAREDEPVSKKP